jgi:hypothetical protein
MLASRIGVWQRAASTLRLTGTKGQYRPGSARRGRSLADGVLSMVFSGEDDDHG